MAEDYTITETEAKELLNVYVTNKCCARKKPLNNIIIKNVEKKYGYLYAIESFVEKRETKQKYIPYKSGIIDGIENGAIPELWAIQVTKQNSFQSDLKKYCVPHSEQVKQCDKCGGCGTTICGGCGGSGRIWVSTTTTNSRGNQMQSCSVCQGSGWVRCNRCSGYGKLKWYLQLKASWNAYKQECVVNELKKIFPNKMVLKAIKKSAGFEVLTESLPKVTPLYDYPDLLVKEASIGLNDYMEKEYESNCSRILDQTHQLDLVNIAAVSYEYNSKDGMFVIYGNNKVVYFPHYPVKCCCCCCLCTIL